MSNVVRICQPIVFTYAEASELLPLIKRMSDKAQQDVEKLLAEQRWLMKSGASKERVDSYDKKVSDTMNRWGAKVLRLGCMVWTTGFVGFDNGSGYWSWRGEPTIQFYHSYTETPFQRRQIGLIPIGAGKPND